MKRIGVFGGTFDPIHNGHLAAAQAASELLGLDRVLFVPAGRPPHKRGRQLTEARHRLAMVRLAIRGNRRFQISPVEIDLPKPSFTIDTLQRLCHHRDRADLRLHLLIGMDQAEMLDTWKKPEGLFAMAEVDVLTRPGHTADKIPARWRHRARIVEIPSLDISSSQIRLMVAQGRCIDYLVPGAVAGYIIRHSLYRIPYKDISNQRPKTTLP